MDSGAARPKVAFIEKVFLKRHPAQARLRGVELFNLHLARELAECGFEVCFAAEKSWRPVVEARLGATPGVTPLYTPSLPHPVLNALFAAAALSRRARREGAFGTLLVGNVGNGLVPAIRLLRRARAFGRMVLVAHRETSAKFLRAIADIPGHVVSVCGPIARPFADGGIAAETHVDYGIVNAGSFFPREAAAEGAGGSKVRFCVVGALDNAWKGADTAIAAFKALPDDVRGRCELHLLAYEKPPAEPFGPGIVAYAWQDADTLPAFLRGMDAMVVPSRDEEVMRETFSQATVQGMLTALPVIHSDLPILNEKFDAGGGIVFKDVQSLSAAIARLAADAPLRARLGAEARATALSRYVWDTRRFCSRYLA